MGVAAGDVDNDGWVDLYLTNFGAEPAVPQQRRRHVHRRVEQRAAPTIARLERVGIVRRLRPRRMAGPLRGQLRALHARDEHAVLRRLGRRGTTVRPTAYSGQPDRLYRNAATARSPTSRARRWHRRASPAPALGVVDRRLQRRRLDRHLRRQRRQGQPAVDEPAERHASRTSALLAGRRADRRRQGRGEHGRGRRRLRQRRRRGSVHHRADRRGQQPVRQRRHRRCSRTRARLGPRRARACRTPASARRGSTSTTTAGWTC